MSTEVGKIIGVLQLRDEATGVISKFAESADLSISGLSGVVTKFGQNLGSIGGIVRELGGPFEGLGGVIGGFAAGGPAGAGIAMIGQGVGFLKDSVKAAKDSEQVMGILRTTVENQGTAWGTVKDAINETLLKMQATTRYSDEELAQALTTLVSHGMSVEGAMNALNTAMDTATGTGRPLETIAEGIAKAYEGQDSALTRLVPAIGDLDGKMGAGATSGDKFQATLGILNDRFGGTAAADAETFAGVQERMANAWDQFQETVGNAVLPALTDLMNGLMTISNEAIKPLMDAFGELWTALFGGDFDLSGFGDFILNMVIFYLKGLATFIKEDLVPTVRAISETFQKASEVIGPPLKTICDAVTGFITTLTDAFQGFYDWLVGRSLWMDMWNQLLSVASELVGKLLGDLGSKLFEPMKNAFTGAMQAVQDFWDKGWQNLQDAGKTVWDAITSGVSTVLLDPLKTMFPEQMKFVEDAWSNSWTAMQSAGKTTWDLIQGGAKVWEDLLKGDLQGALDQVKQNWDTAWNAVQTAFGTVSEQLKTGITGFLDSAKTTVSTGLDSIKTNWETNWNTVHTAFTTISGQIGTTLNTKLEEMKTAISTSTSEYAPIATSALNGMQSAVNAGMALIKGDWQGALDNITGALKNWGDAAKGIMDGIMTSLQGAVSGAIGAMQGAWNSFIGGLSGVAGQIQSAASGAIAAAQQAAEQVAAGTTYIPAGPGAAPGTAPSWPSWPTMQHGGIVPITGPYLLHRGEEVTPSTRQSEPGRIEITTTVPVTIDGDLIYKIVQKRLIERRQYSERSIGRLT